jgi:hypothetical protein
MVRVVVAALLITGSATAVSEREALRSQPTSAEARAVAFLAREVPRWRKEHPCYSCHNNGDAARALITAVGKGHTVGSALDDTLVWLRDPKRWNGPSTTSGLDGARSTGDKMPQGGSDDKPLARIQFAGALRLAMETGLAQGSSLAEAAHLIAADQRSDGSWQLDSSQSLGSPTTYGTILATASALRTLRAAKFGDVAPAIERGNAWLGRVPIETVLDAAGALIGLQAPLNDARRAQQTRALYIIRKGEAPSGGWGPYVTSPPQVFDTALVVLALTELPHDAERTAAITRGRAFLLAQQMDDGSWPETTRPANQESYAQRISTTGWALLALLETGR